MKDFETTLRERLDRRASTVHPLADLGDLDVRIDAARRRRARITAGAISGVCAMLALTVVATALTDDGPKQGVTAEGGQTEETLVEPTTSLPDPAASTTPSSAADRIVVGDTTPRTSTPAAAFEPADPTAARAEIAAAYKLVFEAGASDEQRRAVIVSLDGLQELWDAARTRPEFADFALVRVRIDRIDFSDPEHATVSYSFTSSDPVKYPGTMMLTGNAQLVDGRWKVQRDTVCDGAARLAQVAGLTLTCGTSQPPKSTSTSMPVSTTSTTVPATTSTTAPTGVPTTSVDSNAAN
jgi:hypothetical protein